MRDSLEAKKTEKPDAQLQVGDAKDVDFGRVWHLNFDVHAVYQDIYIYVYIYNNYEHMICVIQNICR